MTILPSSIGELVKLEQLDLSHNQLTGPLPSSLGNLTRLESLLLGQNKLAGHLPSSLGNLTRLKQLNLSFNQFTRSIPASFGQLTALKQVALNDNPQLWGAIPKSWAFLPIENIADCNLNGDFCVYQHLRHQRCQTPNKTCPNTGDFTYMIQTSETGEKGDISQIETVHIGPDSILALVMGLICLGLMIYALVKARQHRTTRYTSLEPKIRYAESSQQSLVQDEPDVASDFYDLCESTMDFKRISYTSLYDPFQEDSLKKSPVSVIVRK